VVILGFKVGFAGFPVGQGLCGGSSFLWCVLVLVRASLGVDQE